jgi:hypothetical protein
MAMIINNKFNIADIVYIKTDEDQNQLQVLNIIIELNDLISYTCRAGFADIEVNEFELTDKKILV